MSEPISLSPNGINEGNAPITDRLTTTLFLAGLFHGIVILGVTFAIPATDRTPAPILDVLLLTGPDSAAADNANAPYLAQRNQQGTGNTDEPGRPANPASSVLPLQQPGLAHGQSNESSTAVAGEPSREFVGSRADHSDVSSRSGSQQPSRQAQIPLVLSVAAPSPIVTTATDKTLRLRGRQSGEYELIPDSRESKLAPYLDSWRYKIEQLGTMNFPQVVRRRLPAVNPVLEVAIGADGRLEDIVVRRSSGRKEIDQAALAILRLASPFDPFPTEVRKQYDLLRFAYEWQFLQGGSAGAITVPAAQVDTRTR